MKQYQTLYSLLLKWPNFEFPDKKTIYGLWAPPFKGLKNSSIESYYLELFNKIYVQNYFHNTLTILGVFNKIYVQNYLEGFF